MAMITRRLLLGAAALLPVGLGKARHALVLREDEPFVVLSRSTVGTFNGYAFSFDWNLEPGDVVRVSREAGINGVFVMVEKPDRSLFAWSFHTASLTSWVKFNECLTRDYLKDLSLRRGHNWRRYASFQALDSARAT